MSRNRAAVVTPSARPPAGGAAVLHARRRLSIALLGLGVLGCASRRAVGEGAATEGVASDVGKRSSFAKLVPASQLEQAAAQQFVQLQQQAASKHTLASAGDPQLVRLRFIAQRIIPYTPPWNARAAQWRWEVQLINTPEVNAFCMPGGKIVFFSGILQRLQLNDDEAAIVMGHEMAHALREHARERIGKSMATRGALEVGSAVLGLGGASRMLADVGEQLLTLSFSREDESEADLVGMELAARAGYDPAAGVTLWRKMDAAGNGGPPEFLSTHPSSRTRVKDIEAMLPKVQPLYARAPKPPRRFGPPPAKG